MYKVQLISCLLAILVLAGCSESISNSAQQSRPSLTFTSDDVSVMLTELPTVPRAVDALTKLKQKIEAQSAKPMDVPVPADAGGGYTHEQHKRNYQFMYNAALLYQLTKEPRYLELVKAMLLAYAELYPTLGTHPRPKEITPGKLFWQSLNESVWLVYTIQAYDMIIDSLKEQDREHIENNLLRPVANFLSEGQPETFNKIHNHGTWATAAVGMTGYVLGEQSLVEQALYGLDRSGEAGFLKQIENLFSPDGYYAEGPYYQRYALMPFVLFAKAIEVNEPERKIFEFRDGALIKAIRTSVQLSYNRLFFGINDAIKDKGIDTAELIHGIAIAYEITEDPGLLGIAQRQDQTILTGYGFKVAKALDAGLAEPFKYKSMQLRDGAEGDQGALAIFRNGIEYGHQALVMKNTSHGLGHGHFDKLHWLYFDNGNEVISDYGAARFLNIEAKYGGHYLPENNLWAKQTVAHNTLVVGGRSQFDGDWKRSQKSAPSIVLFDVDDNVRITSASVDDAYEDTQLNRTMAMVSNEELEHPLVIDLFNVAASRAQQYDLPLHYQGHLISHTFEFEANAQKLEPLGEGNGYQFLWDLGRGQFTESMGQLTWLLDGRFYTHSTLGGKGQEAIFAKLGANDPNFNLRDQQALLHRVIGKKNHTFVSVLEQHGEYNGRDEFTVGAASNVEKLEHALIEEVHIVDVTLKSGGSLSLLFTLKGDDQASHTIELHGRPHTWQGHYSLIKN